MGKRDISVVKEGMDKGVTIQDPWTPEKTCEQDIQ